MQYRRFGKLSWKASALGFGSMRMPLLSSNATDIDEPEAIKMIRYAIAHGVNYIDTAYVYHRGKSETLVGKALRDGYRNKVRLATKMPTWLVKSQHDMDRYLADQLQRLETDHVDFYLLHGLNQKSWDKLKSLNALEWLENKVDQGKIGHFGFS